MAAATRRLTLLLDPAAIGAIARKLWTVRNRLSLHTSGNIPSPVELGLALRLYMQRCDADRLTAASRTPFVSHVHPPTAPSVTLLGRLLSIAEAAYFLGNPKELDQVLFRLHLPPPLASRPQAQKWFPGYFVVRDARNSQFLVAIRGSRDVGDLLTNLSSDCEPFFSGSAHQGVINSARNLHRELRPLLARQLVIYPSYRVVFVGHSLGAAAASALTMLCRFSRPPHAEHPSATDRLTSARCYAFSPPPFLDPSLANRSARLPITTVVYGLDVVPRLSAASVDRLLHSLSAYDFSPHVSNVVSNLVRSVTSPVLGEHDAALLANRAKDMRVDAGLLAGMSGTLAQVADMALAARTKQTHTTSSRHERTRQVRGTGRGDTRGDPRGDASGERRIRRDSRATRDRPPTRSPARAPPEANQSTTWWGTAMTAALMATRAIGSEVEANANRFAERRESSAARSSGDISVPSRSTSRLDLGADEVDAMLDGGLQEMVLAGQVWHLDKPFVEPKPGLAKLDWPVPRLVRRNPSFFRDIEVSNYMVADHDVRIIGLDLNRVASLPGVH